MIPSGYEIRLAVPEDVGRLADVERQASTLFDDRLEHTGLTRESLRRVSSAESLHSAQQAGRLWVAISPAHGVAGFAVAIELGGCAHLDELDVLPAHGRMGLGSGLLAAVCAWARQAGYSAVTLSTFRDVPWNAPFYERRGFRAIAPSELSAAHVELVAAERRRRLRTDLRVVMSYQTRG